MFILIFAFVSLYFITGLISNIISIIEFFNKVDPEEETKQKLVEKK